MWNLDQVHSHRRNKVFGLGVWKPFGYDGRQMEKYKIGQPSRMINTEIVIALAPELAPSLYFGGEEVYMLATWCDIQSRRLHRIIDQLWTIYHWHFPEILASIICCIDLILVQWYSSAKYSKSHMFVDTSIQVRRSFAKRRQWSSECSSKRSSRDWGCS